MFQHAPGCLTAGLAFSHGMFESLQSVFLTSQHTSSSISIHPQNIGVGFELSLGYATAAVSFPNGTTKPIIRLDGDAAYVQAMSQFANESLRFYPRDTPNYHLSCFPLPPPLNEAGIKVIGTMIRQLTTESESIIGVRITSANVAIPFLAHLCHADLDEALRYAGIESLYEGHGMTNRTSLYAPSAVLVSNGFGVCKNYTDVAGCQAEESSIVGYSPPYIHITRSWLLSACPHVSSSYHYTFNLNYYAPIDDMIKCGLDHQHDTEDYWTWVYMFLMLGWQSCMEKPSPYFLLSGEAADDPQFQVLLREMMRDFEGLWGFSRPVLQNHTLFAAAEGAAELAKRALWKKAYADTDARSV